MKNALGNRTIFSGQKIWAYISIFREKLELMEDKGISPIYLITDHIGFYERYDWEFLCMVQGDDEPEMTRMYIHH